MLLPAFAHVPMPHPAVTPTEHGATAFIGLHQPFSRGLRLDPCHPAGPPLIDPVYLSDPRDLAAQVHGIAVTREISEQPALAGYGLHELLPGRAVTDPDSLAEVARGPTSSDGHPAGTCALGVDETPRGGRPSTTRARHRQLRIADASIIPTLPPAVPTATVQAIGWRAAKLITTWHARER